MRTNFLIIVFVIICSGVLCAANYYVDATNGNDSNNGTSQGSAWQTTLKVSGFTFNPGDSILFKRGEVFRGGITINQSGTILLPICFGAYGVGDKPVILGSVSMNDLNNWTSIGTNLWATSNNTFPSDVGFLLLGDEDMENVGFKCETYEILALERDFWYDTLNFRVVLYCPQNPGSQYSSIEIAKNSSPFEHLVQGAFSGVSYIHFENIEMKYWNSHAMAFVNAVGIEVRNCNIKFGGGVSYWRDPVTGHMARLGNGIEFWESAQNCIVENCKIGQCFDSGLTPQAQGTASTVSDLYFNNNIFWGNDMASFEIAYGSYSTTLQNIHFENNISIGAGRGWARSQKLHATMGWDITTWAGLSGSFDGFYLKNNVLYRPLDACLYYKWQTPITNFEMDFNYYYKPEDGINNIMFYWENELYRMDEFADFQIATGQDANSSAVYNRFVSQNAARDKVICDDLFFLNILLEDVDEQVIGNLPTHFDLIYPNNEILTGNEVLLTWEPSYSSIPTLDHYEVWINCSHVANVPAELNSFSSSGLNNGNCNWFVIAVCDNGDWRQSSSQFSFEIDNSSSINTDLLYSAVNVFPNPAKRIINIQTEEKEFEVELISNLGSVIFKGNNTSAINVSEIKTGSYILIFKCKNFVTHKKIIIN
jgi:hypothetical protein